MAYRWAKDVMTPFEYEIAMSALEKAQGRFDGMWSEVIVPADIDYEYWVEFLPYAESHPGTPGLFTYRFRMQKLEDNFKQTLFCVTCKDLIMVGYS